MYMYTVEPLLNGHFGTSSVLKKRGALYREVNLYTVAVVGTCVVSVIEGVSVVESAHFNGGSTVLLMHSVYLTASKYPGLSGRNTRARAAEKQGIVHTIIYALQLANSNVPRWPPISVCGTMSQANREAYTRPNVQNDASMIIRVPLRRLEKNSEKYENTTGIDPPTLSVILCKKK